MKNKIRHPEWALIHKKPGTELKLINGRYYLYGVKSVYDKTTKRSKKVSFGIQGSITAEKGFIPSEKQELRTKSQKSYHNKEVFSFEYGFSKWLFSALENEGLLNDLKKYFPELWQFIVMMVLRRVFERMDVY